MDFNAANDSLDNQAPEQSDELSSFQSDNNLLPSNQAENNSELSRTTSINSQMQ